MPKYLHFWEAASRNTSVKHISLIVFLIGILVLAFGIRLQGREGIPDGSFTSNDAYLYYWQAQTIREHGYLPSVDEHRWIPNGRDNTQLLSLYAYVLAYTHKVITLFFYNISLYQVCLYLPIICFVLGLCVFILFLRTTEGMYFAAIVAILLTTLPGSIDRSTIGFSDRDAWCWMLAVFTITSYLWKEQMEPGNRRWIVTALSGITVLLGGLSWEGFGFFVLMILALELWKFCTTETDESFTEYILWVLLFVPWLYLISPAYRNGYGGATHVTPLLLAPPLVILAFKSIRSLLLRLFPKLHPYSRKIALVLALSSIVAGVLYFFLQYETFAKTAFPFHENRLMQTIGELADPDLKYWIGRYGGVFVLGSLGIAASAIYYWKQKAITAAAAIGLLSATVFLHHHLIHWIGHQSSDILFVASVPLTVIGISLAITRKQTSMNETVSIIMLVWFILWVSLSRGGKRYDFFIGVPLAFGTAFIIRYLAASVSENKELVTHRKWTLPPQIMATGITIALLILLLFWNPVGGHATRALHVAKVQNIYPQNQNIRHAYNWIKTQLPSDKTIMAAQWDYGTQLNVHSNVKTITDPDHYLPHWVHLYDRHVYCAQSEMEALYFLKTHHATHLMITSTDVISNAWKNSFVGSDITLDRHFNLHPLLYMPTPPGTQYSLTPQHRLTPSDFTQETDLNFVKIKGQSIKELTVLAHFKTEKNIQIPYIAFHGSTRIRPSQTDKTQKGGLILTFDKQEILRNAFYVPEIGWNSLAFKLFIREEHSNAFESIYTQKTKEKDVPPDVQIWKINYPENIKPHPKYLKTE